MSALKVSSLVARVPAMLVASSQLVLMASAAPRCVPSISQRTCAQVYNKVRMYARKLRILLHFPTSYFFFFFLVLFKIIIIFAPEICL